MGVDCYLNLPVDIGPIHISKVMALAIGAEGVLASLDNRGALTLQVTSTAFAPGSEYKIKESALPGYISIGFLSHGRVTRYEGKIYQYLSQRSYPEAIAVLRRLGQVFGGILILRDVDDDDIERYERPAATMDKHGLYPQDGYKWNEWIRHLAKTKPVTFNELHAANDVSAYQGFTDQLIWSKHLRSPSDKIPLTCKHCGQVTKEVVGNGSGSEDQKGT